MPFDGSGNFTRLYNWQADRDNGIHILAQRMDGEFDNFAGGMNVVFFRNGLVPMSGNLNMGQNSINGLGAGSVGNPSFRFSDDPSTGIYLNGYGRLGVAVAGTERLDVSSTGVAVTGALSLNGTPFDPAGYAKLTGAAFTGAVSSPRFISDGSLDEGGRFKGSQPYITFYKHDESTRFGYIQHTGVGGDLIVNNDQGGSIKISTGDNNAITAVPSGVGVSGVLGVTPISAPTTISSPMQFRANENTGNPGYHADFGYWFPSGSWRGLIDVKAAGGAGVLDIQPGGGSTVFGGGTQAPTVAAGDAQYYMAIVGSNPLLVFDSTDYMAYIRSLNSYQWYINATLIAALDNIGNFQARDLWANRGDGTGAVYLNADKSRYLYYDGSQYFFPGAQLSINGGTAWHSNNFTPGNYAQLSGATFTGAINANNGLNLDSNYALYLSSGTPIINFDLGDYIQYDRSNNKLGFIIGGNLVGSLDAAGNLKVKGSITAATTP